MSHEDYVVLSLLCGVQQLLIAWVTYHTKANSELCRDMARMWELFPTVAEILKSACHECLAEMVDNTSASLNPQFHASKVIGLTEEIKESPERTYIV